MIVDACHQAGNKIVCTEVFRRKLSDQFFSQNWRTVIADFSRSDDFVLVIRNFLWKKFLLSRKQRLNCVLLKVETTFFIFLSAAAGARIISSNSHISNYSS